MKPAIARLFIRNGTLNLAPWIFSAGLALMVFGFAFRSHSTGSVGLGIVVGGLLNYMDRSPRYRKLGKILFIGLIVIGLSVFVHLVVTADANTTTWGSLKAMYGRPDAVSSI